MREQAMPPGLALGGGRALGRGWRWLRKWAYWVRSPNRGRLWRGCSHGKGSVKILMAASCSSDRNLGVPGVMHALADQYRAAGNEVRMSFRDRPGRMGEILFGWRLARSPDVRWADVVDSHAVEAWPLCGRRQRPALVARSHGLETGVHRRLMEARRAGKARVGPVYWTYRGSVRLLAERSAIRSSDASLLLNAADLQVCQREFGADPVRLHLVRNGFPSSFLDHPMVPAEHPGILFLGSWIARKGTDLAVSAISRALRELPETPVLLAGTGLDTRTVLSDFPPDLRGAIRVIPQFRREDLPGLVEGFSILLFPSRSEGYPLSLVEAMALGMAPIATAIPGVLEVIEDGSSGILVPPEDAEATGEALVALLRSPQRLSALREGARRRVEGTSWESIATAQMGIYRTVLDTRSARSTSGQGTR